LFKNKNKKTSLAGYEIKVWKESTTPAVGLAGTTTN
jgi:hypothetical protein